jgi:hypothetical protein
MLASAEGIRTERRERSGSMLCLFPPQFRRRLSGLADLWRSIRYRPRERPGSDKAGD